VRYRIGAALLSTLSLWLCPLSARAWGDEGHEIVALIAAHYLEPAVRAQVDALLTGDTSGLLADTTLASESTWADRYRDSDRASSRLHYEQTRRWHYIDMERLAPDLDAACYWHPAVPSGVSASAGPAADCVIDKINQFEAEFASGDTSLEERRLALQFLLHLLGDLHQPLHAIDDADEGGNRKRVSAAGFDAGSLHYYWDTQFVRALGAEPSGVAAALIAQISPSVLRRWREGSVEDWARESYAVGQRYVYEPLPAADSSGQYHLSQSYVDAAQRAVATQLSAAGVRLAAILNRALTHPAGGANPARGHAGTADLLPASGATRPGEAG
jgi:hypothetical protein